MIRAKIIDIIKSAFGGTLRVDNLAEYKESYTAEDMSPNTLVPYSVAQGLGLEDVEILIPAGDRPYTLVNGTDFVANSLRPLVVQFQPVTYPSTDDTKDTTEGASLRTDYQFADSDKDALVSIDVWVADNTIDTWIRII